MLAKVKCMSSKLIHTGYKKLHKPDEKKFGRGIGIAEKTYKTRKDRWGGNVNHKSLF